MVPVTRADVARLSRHTRLAPGAFLELRSPDEVDIEGEPESLADLTVGPRLVVLAQRDGACIFLQGQPDGTETCSVHDVRPSSCRAYPFDRPPTSARTVGLHPDALCPPQAGHLPVLEDARESGAWATVVQNRDRELHAHAEWIGRFNRRQRLRRRLGKLARSSGDFLHALALPDGPKVEGERSAELAEDTTHALQVGPAEQVEMNE